MQLHPKSVDLLPVPSLGEVGTDTGTLCKLKCTIVWISQEAAERNELCVHINTVLSAPRGEATKYLATLNRCDSCSL